MRTILSLISVALILGFSTGCSEDDAKAKLTTETPLREFIQNGTWSYTQINDGQIYSLGNKFTVKKNGKVTALGLFSPVVGTFAINLYEVGEGNEGTSLASTSVEVTQADVDSDLDVFKYTDLAESVSLVPGKIYCVAYSTNASAKTLNRLDEPAYDLPIESESSQVSILFGVYGEAGLFPVNDHDGSIYMADIKFAW